jgi:tRNA (cytidine32/uridine32-2'-O)-methyltransferase
MSRIPSLDNIRIVLVRPASEGNVGATARAMLNMGLRDLRLVNPKLDRYDPVRWMAHGAEQVLKDMHTVDTVAEAVADTTVVMATTGRKRRWRSWPIKDPTEAARVVLASASSSRVAVVFGPEDKGLSNEDLSACTHLARIPTDAAQTSLNLAQAVLLMSWEIRRLALEDLHPLPARSRVPATAEQVDGTIEQLTEVLRRVGYFPGRNELQVRTTARQVLSRTALTREEIGFLRGSLRKLAWGLENPDKLHD